MRLFGFIAGAVTACLPTVAYAFVPPAPCTGLYGCGGGAASIFSAANLSNVALLLLQFASGAAVFMIVVAGFQMVIQLGNESKIGEMKHAIIFAIIGLAVAIVSEVVISSVGTENYGQNTGGNLPIAILRNGVRIIQIVLNPVMAVIIVVAGIYMVYSQGKPEGYEKGKSILLWTIVGAIIINLANAAVQALTQGIFGV